MNNDYPPENIPAYFHKVPEHIKIDPFNPHSPMKNDPRWSFFQNPQNHTKYYYRRKGDNLEPLGIYTHMEQINPPKSNTFSGFLDFVLYFDKTPQRWFHANIADELYYTYNNARYDDRTRREGESRKAAKPKFPIDAADAKNQIESTLMLKEVPKHRKVTDHSRKNQESDALSFEEDPRWLFFKSPQNRDKQYFVLVRGAPGKDPRFDNTLEYLGNFDKIVERNLYGSNLRDAYRHYTIWFKNAGPMTSHINENDELYYSTEDEEADRRKKTEADRRLRERNARRFRSQEAEKQDKEESRRLSEVLKREEEYRRSKYVDNQDEDEADRQIRATFNFMDSEMKGIIDVRELKAALLAIGFEVHKDDIRRLYHYINKDLHDGNITLEEYRKIVYKLWEEVSMSEPKKFSSKEKHDEASRLMREVLNFEDWREEHKNEKKEYDDDLSYDEDDREVRIRLKNSKPKSKDVKYTSASPKLETDVVIRPTHTYGEFRKDAEYIGDFDPTKPQFHNTNFTNVPLSKPNILLMETHNGLKGGRKQHNKKTRKYFKKYTKTKNTKTKNKRLKYKKV